MGCGRKNTLLGHLSLLPLFLTVAVLARTQSLSLAASEGATAGYRRGRNSTDDDDLGRRRFARQTAPESFETLSSPPSSSSSSSSAAAGEGAASSVRDQIDRGLARSMMMRRPHEMDNASSSSSSSGRITRYYRLYSRCSSKHLRIAGRHVDTLALPGDIYSELQMQTRSFDSQLTIQGSRSMNYLCFSKKGRLTIKHSGHDRRCVFREIHSPDHFTQFQSTFNPDWMIGFGRKGQRLHGDWRSKPPKQHRCFQFVKTDFPYLGHDLNRPGAAGAGVPLPPNGRRNSLEQLQSNLHSARSEQRRSSKT